MDEFKVLELSKLVWKKLKESRELKALYEAKHVVVPTLCEEALRQGYETLSNEDLISTHDGFLLYKRIQMCLTDKEIGGRERNIIRLIMDLDGRIADTNDFLPKAMLMGLKDEWLRLKREADECREWLEKEVDAYIVYRTVDGMTWKKVGLTKERGERVRFAIHVMIYELMNKIGAKRINAYAKGQKVVTLIKQADELTLEIEDEMKPLIDKGDMVTLTELMGRRFDLEQELNAAIDAYIAENTMLLGKEWIVIYGENQRCTEALTTLYKCFKAEAVSGADYNIIRRPIDATLKRIRDYAVKQILEQEKD